MKQEAFGDREETGAPVSSGVSPLRSHIKAAAAASVSRSGRNARASVWTQMV